MPWWIEPAIITLIVLGLFLSLLGALTIGAMGIESEALYVMFIAGTIIFATSILLTMIYGVWTYYIT